VSGDRDWRGSSSRRNVNPHISVCSQPPPEVVPTVAIPQGCSESEPGLSYSCVYKSILGDGSCNSPAFLEIVANLGEAQKQGFRITDVIHACNQWRTFQIATGNALISPSKRQKPFAPPGFDWGFPGLREIDARGLYVLDNFLSQEEVHNVKAVLRQRPESLMSWGGVKNRELSKGGCTFGKSERRDVIDLKDSGVFKIIHDRYALLTGKPKETASDWFAHKYKTGGFISDHHDATTCERDLVLNHDGQFLSFPLGSVARCDDPARRQITILTYLSDVPEEAGGATYFPKLGVHIQPKVGKTILFFPTYLDKTLNPFLSHRGDDSHVPDRQILQMWIKHGGSEEA